MNINDSRDFYRRKSIAAGYDARRFVSPGGRKLNEKECRAVTQMMGESFSGRILELACGTGRLSAAVSALGKSGKLFAIDSSISMMNIARETVSGRVEFILADALRAPIKKHSMDACISLRLFHHFSPKQLNTALDCLKPVLKKKAPLIFNTTNPYSLAVLGAWTNFFPSSFARHYFLSDAQVNRSLKKAGFYILEKKHILFMPSFALRILKSRALLKVIVPLNNLGELLFPKACSMTFWKVIPQCEDNS